MKSVKSFVVPLILVWIVAKLLFYFSGEARVGFEVLIFTTMFFILVIECASLWLKYKTITLNDSNFLDDIKTVVRAASGFILGIMAFTLLYYTVIDSKVLGNMVEARVENAEKLVLDVEGFEAWKAGNPTIAPDFTPEDYIEKERKTAETVTNPLLIVGGGLLVWVLFSVFNGVFVTILFRKVLLKQT
jgi:hypothetical protein